MAVGADRVHWPGVVGVINSVIANSATPSRLRLHILTPAADQARFTAFLSCHGLTPGGAGDQLHVLGFDAGLVPVLKVQTKLTNLESPLNFARFYLHKLLPTVDKVLYLDADVVVQGDAAALYDGALAHDELCAATARKMRLGDKGVASLRSPKLLLRFRERWDRHPATLPPCYPATLLHWDSARSPEPARSVTATG